MPSTAFCFERVPGVYREVDPQAKLIGYLLGPRYKGTLFTVLLSKSGVKVGFAYGASLPDPDQLLTGRGKVHRHVPIGSLNDIHEPAFLALIDAAVDAYRERTS